MTDHETLAYMRRYQKALSAAFAAGDREEARAIACAMYSDALAFIAEGHPDARQIAKIAVRKPKGMSELDWAAWSLGIDLRPES